MTEFSPLKRYEIIIHVEEPDIDELGHVNNTIYLRWVQDAAVAHWTSGATEEQLNNILWVVSRHEIDYKQAAHLGDDVIASTWVGNAQEILFERHTEIFRASDRKLLAKARSLWIPINRKTGRILRVDASVRERWSVEDNRSNSPD
jgi:acyl-CoA thioester hydrolase